MTKIEAELNIQPPISKYASTPKLQISNGIIGWGIACGFGFVTCGNRQIPKHQDESNNHSTRIDVPNGLGNWDLESAVYLEIGDWDLKSGQANFPTPMELRLIFERF